jgi:hypothetical protein
MLRNVMNFSEWCLFTVGPLYVTVTVRSIHFLFPDVLYISGCLCANM